MSNRYEVIMGYSFSSFGVHIYRQIFNISWTEMLTRPQTKSYEIYKIRRRFMCLPTYYIMNDSISNGHMGKYSLGTHLEAFLFWHILTHQNKNLKHSFDRTAIGL